MDIRVGELVHKQRHDFLNVIGFKPVDLLGLCLLHKHYSATGTSQGFNSHRQLSYIARVSEANRGSKTDGEERGMAMKRRRRGAQQWRRGHRSSQTFLLRSVKEMEYRISSPKMSFFSISKFRLYPRATILLPINHNILKSLVFVIFDNIEDDLVI